MSMVAYGSQTRSILVDLSLNLIDSLDLTTHSVLVSKTGTAKITDYGTSNFPAILTRTGYTAVWNQTTEESSLKKIAAPEVWKSRDFSQASDMWAYAITTMEIVQQQEPAG